jgi:flagellar basal body P-ring protein FlgI
MKGCFLVAGVSTQNGVTKVRFANDLASRVKLLSKGGHNPLELISLPQAMSKAEACQHLIDIGGVFEQWKSLINDTMNKKTGVPTVQNATVTPKAPNVAKVRVKAKAPAKAKTIKQPKIVLASQAQDDDLEIEELKNIANN